MKRFHFSKWRFTDAFRLVLICSAFCVVSCPFVVGADTNSTDAVTAPKAKKVEKKLSGSELYSINCNRCHPERYPTEFNSAAWKTLMIHMRVRANVPAKQAKEILKYLQEESGN